MWLTETIVGTLVGGPRGSHGTSGAERRASQATLQMSSWASKRASTEREVRMVGAWEGSPGA
eukprot:5698095-Pyramimonas_sp.AAC.1